MSVVLSGPLSLNRILVTRAVKEQGATGLDKEHEIYQHAINWRVTELFCLRFYQSFHLPFMGIEDMAYWFIYYFVFVCVCVCVCVGFVMCGCVYVWVL